MTYDAMDYDEDEDRLCDEQNRRVLSVYFLFTFVCLTKCQSIENSSCIRSKQRVTEASRVKLIHTDVKSL